MRPISWSGLVATLLAAALGAVLSPAYEAEPPLVKARRDPWDLSPMPRKPDAVAQALALSTASIFEPEAVTTGAGAPPPEDNGWRVAATFRRGAERSILLQFNAPTKAAQQLRVGDVLPSGERISSIDDAEIVARKGKTTVRYGVQRHE